MILLNSPSPDDAGSGGPHRPRTPDDRDQDRSKAGRGFDCERPDDDGNGARDLRRSQADLRQKAEELRRSEERYRDLVEQVRDYAIFSTDPDGRITTWNRGCREVLGYEEDEFIGLSAVELFTPEDRARGIPEAEFEEARRAGRASNDRWMMAKDGRRYFAFGVTTALYDEAGNHTGFGKVLRDQTEWKRVHEALQVANEELRRFASIASHDLRQPLHGISRLAAFITQDDHDALSEESRTRLARIQTLCGRLADMVNGLLEYARTAGRRASEPCPLSDVARRAADNLEDVLQEGAAEVVIEDGMPVVRGDRLLLERVFSNLISNAIRYNERPVKRIEIGWAERDGSPEVFVRDNGIGIDPRHHSRIFEIFQRGTNTHADHDHGAGLGLALVRKIMEQHGGGARVESIPGQGSTFFLFFPPVRSEGGAQ